MKVEQAEIEIPKAIAYLVQHNFVQLANDCFRINRSVFEGIEEVILNHIRGSSVDSLDKGAEGADPNQILLHIQHHLYGATMEKENLIGIKGVYQILKKLQHAKMIYRTSDKRIFVLN